MQAVMCHTGGGGGDPPFPLRKNPLKIGPKTVFLGQKQCFWAKNAVFGENNSVFGNGVSEREEGGTPLFSANCSGKSRP